jgi:hypothetical protein
LKLLHDGSRVLTQAGVRKEMAESLRNLFGVSSVCNILGAIKMAKYLRLGPDDNVVTIATDGIDRYHSVLGDLSKRTLEIEDFVLERWHRDIFIEADEEYIYDFRKREAKERLYRQKEKDWLPFGYSRDYLDTMKKMDFWEKEYAKTKAYDKKIAQLR